MLSGLRLQYCWQHWLAREPLQSSVHILRVEVAAMALPDFVFRLLYCLVGSILRFLVRAICHQIAAPLEPFSESSSFPDQLLDTPIAAIPRGAGITPEARGLPAEQLRRLEYAFCPFCIGTRR